MNKHNLILMLPLVGFVLIVIANIFPFFIYEDIHTGSFSKFWLLDIHYSYVSLDNGVGIEQLYFPGTFLILPFTIVIIFATILCIIAGISVITKKKPWNFAEKRWKRLGIISFFIHFAFLIIFFVLFNYLDLFPTLDPERLLDALKGLIGQGSFYNYTFAIYLPFISSILYILAAMLSKKYNPREKQV